MFFILALVTSLTGCFDLSSSVGAHNGGQSVQTFTVSGTFFVKGAVPSALASSSLTSKNTREAVPSYPGAASLYYNLTAEHSDGTNATGTVNGTSFSIKLNKTGTWNLKAEGYSDEVKATKVFKGSTKVVLTPDEPVKNDISIELNPLKEGTGNISLVINVDGDSGIKSIKAELKSASSDSTFTGGTLTFETFPATISKPGIESGAYLLTVYFYDKAESDTDKNLIYAAQETVNVFDNLTTDWWQGTSEYIDSTDGTFTVTKENVENFARTTFFVQGKDGTYTPPKAASDTNTGTYFDPYATLQKAGKRILEINDEVSVYTIYVDGKITAEFNKSVLDLSSLDSSKKLNINIIGFSSDSKAVLQGNPDENATIDESWCTSVIEFGEDPKKINSVLKNLLITGGRTWFGGGIRYYGEDLNYSLEISDCTVSNNYGQFAGGMMIQGGIVTLTNGTVIGDLSFNSAATADKYSNYSPGNGGGITVNGYGSPAKLIMKEGTYVCGNYTSGTESGGGVHVQNSAEFVMEEGSYLQYNGSSLSGGGIAVNSNRDANDSREYCKVKIAGNIIGNNSNSNGGGIYISEKPTVTLIGGTISGNTVGSGYSGSAIYDCGNLIFDGSTIIDSNNDVYLYDGSTIEIGNNFSSDSVAAKITFGNTIENTEVLAGSNITDEICSCFEITPTTDSNITTYWTLRPDNTGKTGVLKKQLVNTTINMPIDNGYKFKVIENESELSFEIIGAEGRNVSSKYIRLLQNGNAVCSATDGTALSIPSMLPHGINDRYELLMGAVIDGEVFEEIRPYLLYKAEVSEASALVDLAKAINDGAATLGMSITLTGDVDLSATDWSYMCLDKTNPESSEPFNGTFDGGGNTIKLPVTNTSESINYAGLFGSVGENGIVQNLTIECDNISIINNSTKQTWINIGGIAVYNYGTIRNCVNKADIKGKALYSVAGICAVNKGIIENCLNTGNIENIESPYFGGAFCFAGGICGWDGQESTVGKVFNCYNAGTITATYDYETSNNVNGTPGAICGRMFVNASIENCYWKENCVVKASNILNCVAYKNIQNLILGTVTSCGSVPSGGGTTTITAGTEANCGSEQTLSYGTDLITALNGWIDAQNNPNDYKRWKLNETTNLPELIY